MRFFWICLCVSFTLAGNNLMFSYSNSSTNGDASSSMQDYDTSKKGLKEDAKNSAPKTNGKKQVDATQKKGVDDSSDIIHFSAPVDCSHLAPREQAFAKKLTEANKYTFCKEFTIEQRIEAMTMASEQITVKGANGKRVKKNIATPDEAVQIINQNKP